MEPIRARLVMITMNLRIKSIISGIIVVGCLVSLFKYDLGNKSFLTGFLLSSVLYFFLSFACYFVSLFLFSERPAVRNTIFFVLIYSIPVTHVLHYFHGNTFVLTALGWVVLYSMFILSNFFAILVVEKNVRWPISLSDLIYTAAFCLVGFITTALIETQSEPSRSLIGYSFVESFDRKRVPYGRWNAYNEPDNIYETAKEYIRIENGKLFIDLPINGKGVQKTYFSTTDMFRPIKYKLHFEMSASFDPSSKDVSVGCAQIDTRPWPRTDYWRMNFMNDGTLYFNTTQENKNVMVKATGLDYKNQYHVIVENTLGNIQVSISDPDNSSWDGIKYTVEHDKFKHIGPIVFFASAGCKLAIDNFSLHFQ